MTFHTFHSLTGALIHTLAKQELQALNWPVSLRLEYGLSWSQDDGVVLWGDLSSHDLVRIIPGLRARRYLSRADARALFSAVPSLGVTVRIAPSQSWYRHAGGARMSAEGFPDSMAKQEKCLLKALQEQYACLCGRVKTLGYRLTEGTYPEEPGEVLFIRRTENITLEAVAVDPCDCGYCDTDEAILTDYIRLILEDNARVASVRFQVTCAGQLMAECWASEVVILAGQPVKKWVDRYEIQYVASEARAAIAEQARAFRSFMHAA